MISTLTFLLYLQNSQFMKNNIKAEWNFLIPIEIKVQYVYTLWI